MVLDPIPQSLPVHFFGSRPQPPTSPHSHTSWAMFTDRNESWHSYEWFICHYDNRNESWHSYEWVMALIWMSHGTHMNESQVKWHIGVRHEWYPSYEWVMALIWRSHGTHMNESQVISHIGARHESHPSSTIHVCRCIRTRTEPCSPIQMSHVTQLRVMSLLNESCLQAHSHTRWAMFTNRNEPCSLIGMSHVTPLRVLSAGAFAYADGSWRKATLCSFHLWYCAGASTFALIWGGYN